MYKILYFLCLWFVLNTVNLHAQIQLDSTTITLTTVAQNLDTPWEILWGPDDHIWFTERKGTVNRLNPVSGAVQRLITISDVQEQGESGLLGMALHPDFSNPDSQFVYLVYTYTAPPLTEKLVRYTYQGTTLVNPLVLLDNIPASNNHDGSRVIITSDRKILMSTGDAQNTSLAQNMNSLAGKILRLNLDGSVPQDNPDPSTAIWTIGHRNPQGLVETPNGMVYSSEHGPSNDDEINIISGGGHYGWPDVQGYCNLAAEISFCNANNVSEPIYAWTPTLAVAGLDYYDHPAIPEWQNSLLLVNLKQRDLRVLHLNATGTAITGTQTFLDNQFGRLRDICVTPDGNIYISTSNLDGRNNNPDTNDDRILKLENESFISLAEKAEHQRIHIFPNPVDAVLHLNSEKHQAIQIFNLSGIRVQSGLGSSVYVGHLTPGLYIIEVSGPEGKSRQRFMKL